MQSEDELMYAKLIQDISRIFPSLHERNPLAWKHVAWEQLALMKSASNLVIQKLRSSEIISPSLKAVALNHVTQLGIGCLYVHELTMKSLRNPFANLTSLTLGVVGGDISALKLDLPRSCVTVRIRFPLFKYIVNCPHIKNRIVELYADSSQLPLIRVQIEEFQFQLETFVFISHKVRLCLWINFSIARASETLDRSDYIFGI